MTSRMETVVPQGLKPASLVPLGGMAEGVPFPKPSDTAADVAEAVPFPPFDTAADIKEVVKQKYGEAALRVKTGGSSCCGSAASTGCADPITANLYDATQIGQI